MASAAFQRAQLEPSQPQGLPPPVLPLGIAPVDALLPGGGLPCGVPIELMGQGAGSAVTSLALRACCVAQQRAPGVDREWCAFVDPTRSLFAPGVARAGVDLERLVVVRPPAGAIELATLELLRARAFGVVVVDLQRGLEQSPTLGSFSSALAADWLHAMARAVANTGTCLLLLTESMDASGSRSAHAQGALVNPAMGLRLELTRYSRSALEVALLGSGGARARARRVPWLAVAADSQQARRHKQARRATAPGSVRYA
jgi:hypothetical protein